MGILLIILSLFYFIIFNLILFHVMSAYLLIFSIMELATSVSLAASFAVILILVLNARVGMPLCREFA